MEGSNPLATETWEYTLCARLARFCARTIDECCLFQSTQIMKITPGSHRNPIRSAARPILLRTATTLIASILAPNLSAQTINWNAGSGDWNLATNWTPAGPPALNSDVGIDNSGEALVTGGTIRFKELLMGVTEQSTANVLRIGNGASVESNRIQLATAAGSEGEIVISDPETSFTARGLHTFGSGEAFVGGGKAIFRVTNGAAFETIYSGVVALRTAISPQASLLLRVGGPGSNAIFATALPGYLHMGNGNTALEVSDGGELRFANSGVSFRDVAQTGNHFTGRRTILVEGSGSRLLSERDIRLMDGVGAGPHVQISGGGLIEATSLMTRGDWNGKRVILLDGAGSRLKLFDSLNLVFANLSATDGARIDAGNLNVGEYHTYVVYTSHGELNLLSGSEMHTGSARVGTLGGDGIVRVSGSDTSWTNAEGIEIANGTDTEASTSEVKVLEGAMASTASLAIATLNPADTGLLEVAGEGSLVSVAGVTQAGVSGAATLRVLSGGTMQTNGLSVAVGDASNSKLTVSGVDAEFTTSGNQTDHVARGGTGTLEVLGGAKFQKTGSGEFWFAENVGSSAGVLIDGMGSKVTMPNLVRIAYRGNTEMTVSDGGVFQAANPYVGFLSGASGTVNVSGEGSEFVATTRHRVGHGGTGVVNVVRGALLKGPVSVGTSGGSGTINVSSGAHWDGVQSSQTSDIGVTNSIGVMNLFAEATAEVGSMTLGVSQLSNGRLNVGQNAVLTSPGSIYIGRSGSGTIHLTEGGSITSQQGIIGWEANGSGSVVIGDPGTTWVTTGTHPINHRMRVGWAGTGELTIQGGAFVGVASTADVGGNTTGQNGGTGTVTVTGDGSVWNVAQGVTLATNTFSTGTVHLNNGGIFHTSGVVKGNAIGTAKLSFDGGELRLTGDQGSLFGGFAAGDLELKSGGGTINTQGFLISTAAVIGGDGGLKKTGSGRLLMAGACTYSGATTVEAGTLALGADGVLPDASPVSVGAATLDVGTFTDTTGPLAITAAATLNFGAGSALAFANSSAAAWEGGSLNLTGGFVSGSSLRFGTTSGGLTEEQLDRISLNGGGGSFSLDENGYLVVGVTGFAAWQAANNTTGGLDDDHDHDGVSNGIEYFLGGGSDTTGFTKLPGVTSTDGAYRITWTKSAGYVGGYGTDFVVESSTTLENPWTPEPLGVNVIISGDDVTFTFPTPPDSRNFARLRVNGR
jgi:fibronectin-binding autotransporter adhesin